MNASSSRLTIAKNFIRALIKRYIEHDVPAYCTQMTYFFIMSIFPMLIVIIMFVISLDLDFSLIYNALQNNMPQNISQLVIDFIENTRSQSDGLVLSISLLITLYSSSRAANAVNHAIGVAYEVEEERSFIMQQIMNIVFTFGLIVLLILVLAMPDILHGLRDYIEMLFSINIDNAFLDIFRAVRYLLIIALFLALIAAVYTIVPLKKVTLKQGLPGTIFTFVFVILVNVIFVNFVSKITNYSAVYGSLSVVIAFMVWLNAMGMIIMIGAEINGLLMSEQGKAILHNQPPRQSGDN